MEGPSQMRRVLVVCHHYLVLSALADLVAGEPSMELVGAVDCVEEAIDQARHHRPDVVLVDIDMPERAGERTARAIRGFLPKVQLIPMSAFHVPDRPYAAGPDMDHPLVQTAKVPDLLRSMTREFPMDDHQALA
jgi:DNA-binding NarL/FixJ family response regulator